MAGKPKASATKPAPKKIEATAPPKTGRAPAKQQAQSKRGK